MTKNWVIWMRVVTLSAAALAILVSALAMSPEIARHVLAKQPVVASAAEVSVVNVSVLNPLTDTKCHGGFGCTVAIIPNTEFALTRFGSAPNFSRLAGYKPSRVGYLPYYPPRFPSQA
jgi:hypothetical protein